MNINLLIDQIILHELDVPRSQRPQIQAALTQELTRLLSEQGLPTEWQSGGTIPKVSITLTADRSINPTRMGQQIAHSMYRQFTQQRPSLAVPSPQATSQQGE